MNFLPKDKLDALERCFDEGRGIRETERLTGVHRDTVSRYFRLFTDPDPTQTPEGGGSQHFELVEHDGYWHIFCWHDDSSEWWRHIAVFHSEKRARLYIEDCVSWAAYKDSDPQARADKEPEDEAPAPATLPSPPVVPAPTTAAERQAKREVDRIEREAYREKRWDEQAAEFPESFCAVCGIRLERRQGEPALNFSKRKTCSPEHATLARQRSREEVMPADRRTEGESPIDTLPSSQTLGAGAQESASDDRAWTASSARTAVVPERAENRDTDLPAVIAAQAAEGAASTGGGEDARGRTQQPVPRHPQGSSRAARADSNGPPSVSANPVTPEGDENRGIPAAASVVVSEDELTGEILPPGYQSCPDCLWSGPLKDYRDHRRDDHGVA